MKEYVAGFLFSTDRSQVVLVCKNRPDWQAGKLNGVGGMIESGESPRSAMVREFKEETGADVGLDHWDCFCKLRVGDCVVWFYRAFKDEVVETVTDELVRWYDVRLLSTYETVSNVAWLVPMALSDVAVAEVHEEPR